MTVLCVAVPLLADAVVIPIVMAPLCFGKGGGKKEVGDLEVKRLVLSSSLMEGAYQLVGHFVLCFNF